MAERTPALSIPPADPSTGLGKYRLDCRLGVGGMAEVFKAHRVSIGGFEKAVVIKRIHQMHLQDPAFVRMFLDEARLAANLNHPNIVHIYEVDEHQGQPYLAMEYVAGPTLQGLVHEAQHQEKLRLGCLARVFAGICDGLHHAHNAKDAQGKQLNIVHRDVSPQNILVSEEGVAKLLDFGVAKARGRVWTTDAGVVRGKVRYVSPEQIRGLPVDGRADVFSTAVCLYEATTGRAPFEGSSEAELLQLILNGRFPKPTKVVPGFPKALEEIIVTGLKSNPAKRWADARAMAEALESFATGGAFAARVPDVAAWVAELFPMTAEAPEARYAAFRQREQPRAVSVPPPLPQDTKEISTADVVDERPVAPPAAVPAPLPLAAEVPQSKPIPPRPPSSMLAGLTRVLLTAGLGVLGAAGGAVVVLQLLASLSSTSNHALPRITVTSGPVDVRSVPPAEPAPEAKPEEPKAAAPATEEPKAAAPAAAVTTAPAPEPKAVEPAPRGNRDAKREVRAVKEKRKKAEPAEAPVAKNEPAPKPAPAEPKPVAAKPATEPNPAPAEPKPAASKPAPAEPKPVASKPAAEPAPAGEVSPDAMAARANVRMAEMFLKTGNPSKALKTVRKALSQDPTLGAAHVLEGSLLAADGDCAGATKSFKTALAINKDDGAAKAGLDACKKK